MATFTNISMASAVLTCCGSNARVEKDVLVFDGAKHYDEVAPQFVSQEPRDECPMLLGWAKQPLYVYWDNIGEFWFAIVA